MPNEPSNPPVTPGQAPSGTDPLQASTSPGQAPSEPPQQDDYQRQIAELRKENAAHRKKAQEQAAAAQAAEEQRLAEQGEFKKLAEKHEAKVKELEPIAASYTKLAEQIHAQIEAEIKDWPAEVKSLVPGADTPAESRLEQMTRLRPLLEKLQLQARGTAPGNRPNPAPANQQATREQVQQANRAALAQRRNYGI